MSGPATTHDAVVVGGGFFGVSIAAWLVRRRGLGRVLLVEREPKLLGRASYSNQARVHAGYHYPRSFTTAYRSRVNFPRFVDLFRSAVRPDFTKVYAIARRNSKVTGRQFERFCKEIGAKLEPAPPQVARLFEPRLIESTYVTEEYAFDATALGSWAEAELRETGVEVRFGTRARTVTKQADGTLRVELSKGDGPIDSEVTTRFVFNCTYAGLNQLAGDFPGTQQKLKHEVAELALVRQPPELAGLGVTVMDGPFFSTMPFPATPGLHTLSHVRYTPHRHWLDAPNTDPYAKLDVTDADTRVDRMIRDAARYLPALAGARYERSLFEVKTVLVKNEGDDGRPILFEHHAAIPGCFSVLGGKLDNVFDVLERLESEPSLVAAGKAGT